MGVSIYGSKKEGSLPAGSILMEMESECPRPHTLSLARGERAEALGWAKSLAACTDAYFICRVFAKCFTSNPGDIPGEGRRLVNN